MRSSKPVLLVEDDCVDVMTVQRAFKELKVPNPLVSTGDGEEALHYLRNDAATKPCVILLDLNMPRMSGMEFMRIAKADESLRTIPIIVFTTSNTEQDITASFELGAAGYMVKSVDYNKFIETIQTIDSYWTLSKLPPDGE
ncbi:MAG: two-component system response regulator [Planctomycetes bacterium RBG_16_55_9]|nr:MAG: two-component system response regulator [Planctomycetes bacterium RBG_16_55_9]